MDSKGDPNQAPEIKNRFLLTFWRSAKSKAPVGARPDDLTLHRLSQDGAREQGLDLPMLAD
jgi:hypothetical protein